MASPAQIAANRMNAMKSTGPRTEDGKAASCMNALKHGIDACASVIPGEDPNVLEALAAQYREHYQPSNVEESFLVDTMIQADWNRRRYARIEGELTTRVYNEMDAAARSLSAAYLPDHQASAAIFRVLSHFAAAQRAWFRAHKELDRIQREAAEAAVMRASIARDNGNWLRSAAPPSAPFPVAAPSVQPAQNLSAALSTPRPAAVNPDRDRNLALRL